MSKSGHHFLAVGAALIASLFGCAGSLQAVCSTVANLTTCPAANTQLTYSDAGGTAGTGAALGSRTFSIYPSSIAVSGVAGPVSKVTVTLNHFTISRGDRVFGMLVGPNGNNIVLFGRPCNGDTGFKNIADKTFTMDDSGPSTFPGAVSNTSAFRCSVLTSSPLPTFLSLSTAAPA